MDPQQAVSAFLAGSPHAVVGASVDREKYGNKVLRAYLQRQRRVFPVHPRERMIEGVPAFASLADLPEPVHGISVITPPQVTAEIIEQAHALGIQHVWLQPGAETPAIVQRAQALGLQVIAGGPCVLVVLGFHEEA